MSDVAIVEDFSDASFDQVAVDKEQLVTMTVDGQLFGVPILQVQDIVEPHLITPVPLAPSAIAGVMNLRGRIVTVINLRRCLGVADRSGDERGMGITVEYHHDLYTLLVDTIGDVRDLPRRDFEKPPATLDERLRRLATGIFRLPEDLLVVLDIERVLDTETLTQTPPVALRRRETKAERAAKEKSKLIRKSATAKKEENAEDVRADEKADQAAARPESGTADSQISPFAPADDARAESKSRSLFERLGGDGTVETAVDLFYSKVIADATLKPFFDGVDMDSQSFMMRMYLTGAFGGPQGYNGRSLREAHKKLVEEQGLGASHFDAFAGHLKATLVDLEVPAELIDEVTALAAATRDDVLNL